MAYFDMDASKIIKLRKFRDLRVDLKWSVNEALGFLSAFWGAVVELNESGEISDWDPEYLCELTHLFPDDVQPQAVWDSLIKNQWIDQQDGDRYLVHDYIDLAGSFLSRKYHNSDRQKLVSIWALHGRIYGRGGGDGGSRPGDKEDNSGEKYKGNNQEVTRKSEGNNPESSRITGHLSQKTAEFAKSPAPFSPAPPLTQRPKERIPSGLAAPPPEIQNSDPEISENGSKSKERRDPLVRVLAGRFKQAREQRLRQKDPLFPWGLAGEGFKKLLRDYSADQIAARFSNYFDSKGWIEDVHAFSVEMFFKNFLALEKGPLAANSNSVGTHVKRFIDGLSTAGAEKEFPGG